MQLAAPFALVVVALAHLITVALAQDAWHLDDAYAIATEQLDPVISPNQQSAHMHKIFGGSNFRAGYNHDLYSRSECSSLALQPDKSNYWMPHMYWYNATAAKPFTPLRIRFRFYYRLQRSSPKQYLSAFPEGLRAMAGSPYTKTPQDYMYFLCQGERNVPGRLCNGFKCGQACPYGVKVVVLFPQCWDGINLWKSDMSHMSYPINMFGGNVQNGQCPFSHPIRVPQIMLEGTWHPEDVAPGVPVDDHLIWAFGDTTGFGAHGDFVNGWDTDLLSRALKTPGSCVDLPNGEIAIQQCEVFAPHYNVAAAAACRPAAGILEEPNGQADRVAVATLPGCNPVWTTGPKPTCVPAVPALDVSHLTAPQGPDVLPVAKQQAFKWPTTSGWHNIGCFMAEGAFNRTGDFSFIDNAMTGDRCRTSCLSSGYAFAGLQKRGNNFDCGCSNQLLPTAPLYPGMCDIACPGGAGTCGGPYALDVWWAGPNVSYTAQKNATASASCVPDTTDGLRQHATYAFVAANMSSSTCISACTARNATWAMTRTGNTCLCGSGTAMYDSGFVPNALCSSPCNGNVKETCGGLHSSNYYSLSPSTEQGRIANGAVYNGCYGGVAGLDGYSLNMGTSMSVEACTASCAELGFSLAGLAAGNTCNCGNWWSGTDADSSSCSVACKGNSAQTCGGTSAQSVYDVSDIKVGPKPSSWHGCYADPTAKLLPQSYFTSDTLTPDLCSQSCAAQGFALSGVKQGKECFCASALPSTATKVPSVMCNVVACAGDAESFCGGATYIAVYDTRTLPASSSATPRGSTYSGCYRDGATALAVFTQQSYAMTLGTCETLCAAKGTRYFGLRLGSICHCGNNAPKQILPSASCSEPCNGNSSEVCGASTNIAVGVYDMAKSTVSKTEISATSNSTGYVGCFARSVTNAYPLSTLLVWSAGMTNEICQSSCASKGYAYAGTQGGSNCYCGHSLDSTSLSYPHPIPGCDIRCFGDRLQWCGSGARMSIVEIAKTGASAAVDTIEGYTGCFSNSATFFEQSPFTSNASAMTTELCRRSCNNKGYTYAGIHFGRNCGCSNTMNFGTELPRAACSSKCTGNSTQVCGGPGTYLSVYDTSGPGALAPSSFPEGYAGCFPLDSGMQTPTLKSNAMTPLLCQSACAGISKSVASVAGDSCYCSAGVPSTVQSYDTSCNRGCPGDPTLFCGQSGRVSTFWVGGVSAAAARVAAVIPSGSASSTAVSGAPVVPVSSTPSTVSNSSATFAPAASSSATSVSSTTRVTSNSTAAVSSSVPSVSIESTSANMSSSAVIAARHQLHIYGRKIVISREV